MDVYMLFNAFPQSAKQPIAKRVELCRFTSSGTFDPAQYPTEDGLYDVYIVGGGGGARGPLNNGGTYRYADMWVGGGGGYAKLMRDLLVTSPVPVTIGAAGTIREWNSNMSAQRWEGGSDGGNTSFGTFGTANGGKRATDGGTGGSGGSGGAGYGCLLGGINGNDGAGTTYMSNSNGNTSFGQGGVGGGNVDYCPTNPYDGLQYGIGGNANARVFTRSGNSAYVCAPAINDNPGRGGGATASALAGICIIYGRPKS